jgi:hypothetical protein
MVALHYSSVQNRAVIDDPLSRDRHDYANVTRYIATYLGDFTFFLGAGASRADEDQIREGSVGGLPSASELAHALAQKLGWPVPEGTPPDLISVASLFYEQAGRRNLAKTIEMLIDLDVRPARIHAYIATLPGAPLIFTTNYDRLIERAFTDAGRPYRLVVHTLERRESHTDWPLCLVYEPGSEAPVAQRSNDLWWNDDAPTVVKVHGSVGMPDDFRDTFVITEDDYYEMAGRQHTGRLLPPHVAAKTTETGMVFVGYGLRDIHMRYQLIRGRRDTGRGGFVFNKDVSDYQRRRWKQQGMAAFRASAGELAHDLASAFDVPPCFASSPAVGAPPEFESQESQESRRSRLLDEFRR